MAAEEYFAIALPTDGDFHYRTADYSEEYEDGECGEPKEVHGFGDKFMEFMSPDDIYDHEN